jgi:(E)-4-hydroxy-3-methylbut-2-enyl-diphosphate synthase
MINEHQKIRRWKTREVPVGAVKVGGTNPIRIQSMTTTDTKDVVATVAQSLKLAEAGCEIIRITAPNLRAAEALGAIRKELHRHKCDAPIVADIHFLPQAAMEAVEHVEKVRVNPGNYADRKKFQIREYTDLQYNEELERLHESFSPLVIRCKELGRTLRIGTNHGSLSDRILNRYGDTPKGMVESAMEFIRIAESHGFQDIILSMKASNPKVMIQAYRLAVQTMMEAGMNYPLHLGVTEAGDGEDGRIKSTIGIGSLLLDGFGDTIRVSLTEDPVHEIPVAKELAARAESLWAKEFLQENELFQDLKRADITPFEFNRHETQAIALQDEVKLGEDQVPRVIVPLPRPLYQSTEIIKDVARLQSENKDARMEAIMLKLNSREELSQLDTIREALAGAVPAIIVEDSQHLLSEISSPERISASPAIIILKLLSKSTPTPASYFEQIREKGFTIALALDPFDLKDAMREVGNFSHQIPVILTINETLLPGNPVAKYRELLQHIKKQGLKCPIWIRNTFSSSINRESTDSMSMLMEAALLSGSLLCDGIGNAISIETSASPNTSRSLAFNILQGARARTFKTEFVACPSCGRTLFDLETTTRKVREHTGHLSGVTIAVMGCIVNGPGEMADADFGYVGGAPGKINLYVGKQCVQSAIPEKDAVDRLIDLIKEHQLWQEPEAELLNV